MSAPAAPVTANKSYEALLAKLRSLAAIRTVSSLVHWDQETKLPARGAAYRATQLADLAAIAHERATDPALGELITDCEQNAPFAKDSPEAANLARIRADYDRATKLPAKLVTELAETQSRAQEAWKDAREKSDFKTFQPWLEKVMNLTKEKARCWGAPEGGELYDALFEEYEPGARAAETAAVFGPLKDRLSALVARVLEDGTAPDEAPRNIAVPEAQQHDLGLKVLAQIGFDLDAGRLDTTTHPFCEGVAPGDTRLTTRYRESSWTDALFGTMHEGGHGLYEQNLPKLDRQGEPTPIFGSPLAEAAGLGTHESQSRLWENFIGRSSQFWNWAFPVANEAFAGKLTDFGQEAVYKAVNRVERSFIRVEADEATYNLHVMLRFDLERAILRDDIAIADIPAAWNENFEKLLGVKVPDDKRGCLQDVHWSFGLVGYFPTYTLGNLMAAQLWQTLTAEQPNITNDIAKGNILPVLEWMKTNIHAHGRRYTGPELCERATGKPLTADPLMQYLETKLTEVYGL